MAFEDLSIEDKLTFLKHFYDKLSESWVKMDATLEIQVKRNEHFNTMFVENLRNKSNIEALIETFDDFIKTAFPSHLETLKAYRQSKYLERLKDNIANATYLPTEGKTLILNALLSALPPTQHN